MTVHWRNNPVAAPWVADAAAEVASRTGLVAHPGRLSVELRPPVTVDKGTVVEELCDGRAAACFLGDDTGDLPAFAALRRLAATRGLAGVAVAAVSAECPDEVPAAADVVVDGPAGALALLGHLAGAGDGAGAGPWTGSPAWWASWWWCWPASGACGVSGRPPSDSTPGRCG